MKCPFLCRTQRASGPEPTVNVSDRRGRRGEQKSQSRVIRGSSLAAVEGELYGRAGGSGLSWKQDGRVVRPSCSHLPRRASMNRLTPLVLVGVMLAGCASDPNASKPIDPSLAQVTIEVNGMS